MLKIALTLLSLVSLHANALDDCSSNTSACSAGYRCSLAAGLLCVPCDPGLYCPQSTYVADESNLSSIICPSGYYCPNATSLLTCPAGYFCTAGTTSTTSCSLYSLLATSPSTALSRNPTTVLEKAETGIAIMSNICKAGSSSVSNCLSGYYCPNASSMIICPQGYYCKTSSIAPIKCPSLLTSCPEGTSAPSRSYLAFIIAGIIVLALGPLYLALSFLDQKFIIGQSDFEKAQHKPAVLKMQKSRRLQSALIHASIQTSGSPSLVASMGTKVSHHYRAFRTISPTLTISYENVSLSLQNNVILAKVSGAFEGGQINAIMGPSGSGKTTFLSLVSGRINFNCEISGSVKVNDEEADHTELSNVTGFVPQDDIVHPDLTVWENLSFAASLKLPLQSNNAQTRLLYVEDALGILQLVHVQHKIVGSVESRGISGGQKKRVSIGLELVGSPSILFLDEPTSGLDSSAALDVLTSLGELAELGMNVISSIHQPRFNAFTLFDKVLFLAPGGKVVYLGSPALASLWFGVCGFACPHNENPADYLMDAICGKIRHPKGYFHPSLLNAWWESHGLDWLAKYEDLNSANSYNNELPGSPNKALNPNRHDYSFKPDEVVDLIADFIALVGEDGEVDLDGIEKIFKLARNEAKELFEEMRLAVGVDRAFDKEQFTQALVSFGTNWGPRTNSKGSSKEVTLPPTPLLTFEIEPTEDTPTDPEEEEEADLLRSSDDPRPLHDSVSKLRFPSPLRQSGVLLQRSLIKYLRCFWPVRVFDTLILVGASVIVGLITKTSWDLDAFPGKVTLAMACLGVLGVISFCRTFLNDKLSLRREVESGISITAYFLTLNFIDLLWLFLAPSFFWGPIYYLILPSQSFTNFYIIGVMILWWVSGLAYLCAIALPQSAVFMTSVFTTLIFGVFCNGITMKISDNRGAGQFILALSFNRWAFEVMTLREYSNYMSSQRTTMVVEFAYTGLCGIDLYDESSLSTLLLTFDIDEQCKKHINTAFGVLLAIGFGLRLVSWIIIKIKSLRAYPKIIRVSIKVAVTAASRVSSRAASIFSGRSHAKKSVEEDEGKEHLRGPSRLMGASNRIVPTQNGPSEAEVEAGSSKDKPTHEVEVEAGSTRDHQVKSEATLEKGVESDLTENLT